MALVEAASFPDQIAAGIACGHLQARGLHAVIFDAGLSSLGLGSVMPARLMVDEDDLEEALRLLSEAGASEAG